jgi:peroxiredoxin
MGVKVISIAFDPTNEQALAAAEYGITSVPMLSDADRTVSEDYGVLKWAVATGEPGHTFILVGENGRVLWLRDYGAPENGGLMYVPVDELVSQIAEKLRQ